MNGENSKSIHWDITRKCNLRCNHCYNADKYFNVNSEQYITEELNLIDCLQTVDKFHEQGFKHIHFLGGEPLSSPIIFDVISHAKKYDMKITINSNAILLNEKLQEQLINLKVDQFAASLDGASAVVNDKIRGNGTFDKVSNNMTQLKKRIKEKNSSMETVLVFTLTKANVDELDNLPILASLLNVDLITLTTFIESGNGKENKFEFHLESNYLCDKIEEMVSKKLGDFDIPLQIDMRPLFCEYLNKKYSSKVLYNRKNSLCSAGEDIWYLEANGNAHPCLIFQLDSGKEALENHKYIKEDLNIKKNSITEILNSDYWHSFMKLKKEFDVNKIPTCTNCGYLDECMPCFIDYGNYEQSIIECEWVKQKCADDLNYLGRTEIHISEDIKYNEGNIYRDEDMIVSFQDEVGQSMWKYMQESKTLQGSFDKILSEYDVDKKWLTVDICLLFFSLTKENILAFKKESPNKKKYIKNDNLVCEEIDSEYIVFDSKNERFYEFDGIGSLIWDNLDILSSDKLINLISEVYQVEDSVVENDINDFIEEMLDQGLIYESLGEPK